jgi:hypothetical protein
VAASSPACALELLLRTETQIKATAAAIPRRVIKSPKAFLRLRNRQATRSEL